jgi:hypothetical protein
MTKSIIGAALLLALVAPVARAADESTISLSVAAVPEKRPAILPALYISFAGLQAYDVYSTRLGVARGAAEANPLVAQAAGNTAGMIAMKAVSTGTAIVVAENLWHTNKTAAILTMVVANGVMTLVALHNASVLHQVR